MIEIVILWVYYTILFGLSFFRYFLALFFNLFNYFVWLRITDEGSIPEMRIWSILLIKSDLKWYIHLGRSLYLYLIQVFLFQFRCAPLFFFQQIECSLVDIRLYSWRPTIGMTEAWRIKQRILFSGKILIFCFFVGCLCRYGQALMSDALVIDRGGGGVLQRMETRMK